MSLLYTPPRAIFLQIQANLADRYGSGFPVLKELIQNAEDAGATAVRFVAHPGWPTASNPLLRVPGILVANDGRFAEKDGRGILSFADSAKGDEAAAIGRFGFGQKAVFHLCDQFVAHALGDAVKFSAVINPCLGWINNNRAESWDQIDSDDLGLLEAAVADFEGGLVLWLPLRCDAVLPAPKLFFTAYRPTGSELLQEIERHESQLRLILAGMRHLDRIEAFEGPDRVLFYQRSQDSQRLLGPAQGNCESRSVESDVIFGSIDDGVGRATRYVGRESQGVSGRLKELKLSSDWPQTPVFTAVGEEMRPEKAAEHGAIIIVESSDKGERGVSLDWGVFLPISKADSFHADAPALRIMLHGYFFVDSGRRFIEGFSSGSSVHTHSATRPIYLQWNETLRDELVLPLLPGALYDAFQRQMLTSAQLAEVTRALRRSVFGQQHRAAIAARAMLARRLKPLERTAGGTAIWEVLPPESLIRPLPPPDGRGFVSMAEVLPELCGWAEKRKLVLVAGLDAALTKKDSAWEPSEVADLFVSLTPDIFLQGGRIAALAAFLNVAIIDDSLREIVAKPLLSLMRRALETDRPLSQEEQIRAVLTHLPEDIVVALPKSAGEHRAVLRALASSSAAPLCVRREWLAEAAERRSLSLTEAAALFNALQPLLGDEKIGDSANAAAVELIKLIGGSLEEAAHHPVYAGLNVLRARSGSGAPQFVTLPELVRASREGRLFRDNPSLQKYLRPMAKATPGVNTLVVTGAAADLLAAIGEPFGFAKLTSEAFANLIGTAQAFGPADARAELFGNIYTDSPEARSALRALAAGDSRAGNPQARLFSVPQSNGVLDDLALRLIKEAVNDFLVPSVVVAQLNFKIRQRLGVGDLDGEGLGQLLVGHAEELAHINLADSEVAALLSSDVQDHDLRELPIFPAMDGRSYIASAVFRELADCEVPSALAAAVPILKPLPGKKATERANRLISAWSRHDQIRVALAQPEPHRFWTLIVDALDCLDVKPDTWLFDRLSKKFWLADQEDKAWPPEKVLDLPDEVLIGARQVFPQRAALPFLPVTELAEELRDQRTIDILRRANILPEGPVAIAKLLRDVEARAPVARMSAEDAPAVAALKELAQQGADLCLPGWPLLAALLRATTEESGGTIGRFACVAEGDVALATKHLSALSALTEKGNDAGRVAFGLAFKTVCGWPQEHRLDVFSRIYVPTESGRWLPAREVVPWGEGIEPGHVLATDLQGFFRKGELATTSEIKPRSTSAPTQWGASGAESAFQEAARSLGELLEPVKAHVVPDLIVSVIGVFGRSRAFVELAKQFRAETADDEEEIWRKLDKTIKRACADAKKPDQTGFQNYTAIRIEPVCAKEVFAQSMIGENLRIPVVENAPFTVIGNRHKRWRRIESGEFYLYEAPVSPVTTHNFNEHNVTTQLIRLAETIARDCLEYGDVGADALRSFLERLTNIEQTKVDAARETLEDRLPHVVAELKPAPGTALRRALDAYDRGERALAAGDEKNNRRADLKKTMWIALQSQEASSELLAAVRSKIAEFGYNQDRVLFELFQNADDAAIQHPPPGEARFQLIVDDDRLRAAHWGRQINHLGDDPDRGQREGWDHDLLNMLLMNLSEKHLGVTGRFGLGFKSVHMLSSDVGIASGFVACRVRGGMLPDFWEGGRKFSSDLGQDGRRATMIDIPVGADCKIKAEAAVAAFRQAARWLPAMSRSIRKIELTGNAQRIWSANLTRTKARGIQIVCLSGAQPGRALALELSEETTLFILLSDDGPKSEDSKTPRLWLLAPLGETLASGWLMNSRSFRVDPGRGSLARGGGEPEATFEKIGAALGDSLLALHDLIRWDWGAFAKAAGLADTSTDAGFWRHLCDLFALDFDDPIARHLHGSKRGFARLIAERPVMPTGLPRPFLPFLRADQAKHVVKGALEDPAIVADMHDWPALEGFAESTVSQATASRLSALHFAAPSNLTLAALVKKEIQRDEKIIPERAKRLGVILNRDRLNRLPSTEQNELLDAVSRGRFRMADGSWREARLPPREAPEISGEEELILAIAPDDSIAESGYEGSGFALYRLSRERSGFQQTAPTLATWAQSASEEVRRKALLRYVLEGAQGAALGDALDQKRPHWLPASSDELRVSALVDGIAGDDLPVLFARLYPEENRQRWGAGTPSAQHYKEDPASPNERVDPGRFLERLHDWWRAEASIEGPRSDRDAYPEDFQLNRLPSQFKDDDRDGWFTFFALAIFRSIGRTSDKQHSSFITHARRRGWWGEMANARLPTDPKPWVDQLEEFARADAWRIDFAQWRRALVDLYVVARWLPDYVDALMTLPAIVREQGYIALSNAWGLSSSPLWQRRGLEAGPLTQSLGLGANWMAREAVRHGIWAAEDAAVMYPYGWASTARLRALFSNYLGFNLGNEAKMDLSAEIFCFVNGHIGERASFLGDLDLPLQIVADGRRDDILRDLLEGAAPLDTNCEFPNEDNED